MAGALDAPSVPDASTAAAHSSASAPLRDCGIVFTVTATSY